MTAFRQAQLDPMALGGLGLFWGGAALQTGGAPTKHPLFQGRDKTYIAAASRVWR